MLLKLIKYDLKSIYKKMAFYYITLFGLALISNVFTLIFKNTNFFAIATLPSSLFILMFWICMFVTMIVSMIRYYKNMLSDEGYLTHTLPVKTSSIILSKLFSTLIVEITSIAVMIISFLCYSPKEFAKLGEMFLNVIKQVIYEYDGSIVFLAILVIVEIIILSVAKVTEVAMCLSLGASHNKNKLVMAFIYYIAINFVMQIVVGTLISVGLIILRDIEVFTIGTLYFAMFVIIGVSLIYLAITYVVNLYTVKNRLNLQ